MGRIIVHQKKPFHGCANMPFYTPGLATRPVISRRQSSGLCDESLYEMSKKQG
jgi:hypothetical protein